METTNIASAIATEVMAGLRKTPKSISSKFFYDAKGSEIFQQIMSMPEYYLTDAEAAIMREQSDALTREFCESCEHVDLVELGAGDGSKTRILLKHLYMNNINFRYVPVDISCETNRTLVKGLEQEFPGMTIVEKSGDYFDMMGELSEAYSNRKIVMFLGSNLGNYTISESTDFLMRLSEMMNPGDRLLLGLDLKKDPGLILQAYDDPHGYTREFNLNLLRRFNRELNANFDLQNFRHVPVYDPLSGAARSYLVSTCEQTVTIDQETIHFNKWEAIFTEMSQKYDLDLIEQLAHATGFEVKRNLYDPNNYFINTIWLKKEQK